MEAKLEEWSGEREEGGMRVSRKDTRVHTRGREKSRNEATRAVEHKYLKSIIQGKDTRRECR